MCFHPGSIYLIYGCSQRSRPNSICMQEDVIQEDVIQEDVFIANRTLRCPPLLAAWAWRPRRAGRGFTLSLEPGSGDMAGPQQRMSQLQPTGSRASPRCLRLFGDWMMAAHFWGASDFTESTHENANFTQKHPHRHGQKWRLAKHLHTLCPLKLPHESDHRTSLSQRSPGGNPRRRLEMH